MSEQARNYSNPLNQLFLFLGGYLIGMLSQNIKMKNSIALLLFLLGLILFIIYPSGEKIIGIVTGTNRLIFTLCCFLICLGVYKMNIQLPSIIHKPLSLLGEASYSIYLFHPIAYTLSGLVALFAINHNVLFPEYARLLLSIFMTFTISYFIFQYFEKYFIKMGK